MVDFRSVVAVGGPPKTWKNTTTSTDADSIPDNAIALKIYTPKFLRNIGPTAQIYLYFTTVGTAPSNATVLADGIEILLPTQVDFFMYLKPASERSGQITMFLGVGGTIAAQEDPATIAGTLFIGSKG